MRKAPSFGLHPKFEFRPVQGDLNAASDKAQFVKGGVPDEDRVPVFAGATFEIWNPDFGLPYGAANISKITKWLLDKCRSASRNKRSAHYQCEYESINDLPFSHARIAYRGVSNSNNTRTFIVCLVPPKVVMTHGSPYLKFRAGEKTDEAFLLGVMSSIPFDWYMRKWVELNVTFEILAPAPIPDFERTSSTYLRLVEISGRLAAFDKRYSEWAESIGVQFGSVNTPEDREELLSELDALVGLLYGLSRDQVEHIYKTFHRGWDYKPRLEKVLGYFDQLSMAKK